MAVLRLLIADDHKIVRDGLRSLIEAGFSDVEIVGEAADGREAVREIRRLQPDVVLMDISMPRLNGLEAIRQLSESEPDCKVIALSMHRSSEVISQVLGAGAKGYLHKDTAFSELESAIRGVGRGDVYLGSGVAKAVVDDYKRLKAGEVAEAGSELTRREREVLQLVAEGHRSREIAKILSVSSKTVEAHRSQILRKLGLEGIAELTKYAIKHGMIDVND